MCAEFMQRFILFIKRSHTAMLVSVIYFSINFGEIKRAVKFIFNFDAISSSQRCIPNYQIFVNKIIKKVNYSSPTCTYFSFYLFTSFSSKSRTKGALIRDFYYLMHFFIFRDFSYTLTKAENNDPRIIFSSKYFKNIQLSARSFGRFKYPLINL